MSRCQCERDPTLMRTAREFKLSTANIPIITCRHCRYEQAREEFRAEEEERRSNALTSFMDEDSNQRWEMLFNFMYKQGWRP